MIHDNAWKPVNHAGWVIQKDVMGLSALHRKQAIGFEDADMASYFSTLEVLIDCESRKGYIGVLVASQPPFIQYLIREE